MSFILLVVRSTAESLLVAVVMEAFSIFAIVGFLLVLALLWGAYYLIRSGCLHNVKIWIGRPDFYELQIAYKVYKGSYMKSGEPFGMITKLLPNLPCINAYYDDPQKVPDEECRYICGVILSEGLDKTPDLHTLRRAKEFGFKFQTFPRVDRVMKTCFPFTTSISPVVGAMKVYPRLAKFVKESEIHAYPYLEICKDGVIHYMCVMEKHEEFIVEEWNK